jgi:large subunit ribosomal protein L4
MIPKGMRAAALVSVLSKKFADGEVLFVDSLSLSAPKTKDAVSILSSLGAVKGFNRLSTKRKNAALVLLAERNDAVEKSFRNIGSIGIDEARNLNPVSALQYTYLVIEKPDTAVALWQKRIQ